jgi:hypothetical protein
MRRSLTGVVACVRQLDDAIHNHDFEAVEGLARHAVNLWFTARASYRRLVVQSGRTTPLTITALEALEGSYRELGDRFGLATRTIAVPRMAKVLAEQRATMDAARTQPL